LDNTESKTRAAAILSARCVVWQRTTLLLIVAVALPTKTIMVVPVQLLQNHVEHVQPERAFSVLCLPPLTPPVAPPSSPWIAVTVLLLLSSQISTSPRFSPAKYEVQPWS